MLKKSAVHEALVLEELFYDQLHFGVSAMLELHRLPQLKVREIKSFAEQLEELTEKNIQALSKFV